MKFKHGTRRRALEYEKDWVKRWKSDGTFEKSVENRSKDNPYVFYDGPPFISGNPHHGTLLSSIVKDAIPRYQTMKGKRVERVWGWDCHGLPAERFTEKKLDIKSREEVIDYGIEPYITACRANMVQTSGEWNDVVARIGRWVDMDNAYKTMDKEYMESVWWAFKELYEKGKIYEGEKVLMYCTLDATPLSKAEVTMDAGAYQDVTDPSVFVKFKLKSAKKKKASLKKDAKVLFVCYGNVSRSQIAKALYNDRCDADSADSAGTNVDFDFPEATTYGGFEDAVRQVHASDYEGRARAVLIEDHGIDIVDSPRQQVNPRHLEDYDLIVNIAQRDQTPDWLRGDNVVWWDIRDPAGLKGIDAMRRTRDYISKKIDNLIAGDFGDDSIDAQHLLAWTTTPWTLPANTALAVNPGLDYVEVKTGEEQFILAKELVDKVLVDEKHQPLEYEIVCEIKGSELVGSEYEPLFEDRNKSTVSSKFDMPIRVLVNKDFHDDAVDFDKTKARKREAARAILKNDEGKIAMMYSQKYDYCKLPGGGIDPGESREDALKRELQEEVGANAKVLGEVGTIEERRSLPDGLHQISYAYECRVDGEVGENKLEEGEKEEEFEVVWLDLDEAIELTSRGNRDSDRGIGMRFMALRDETFLREYKKQLRQTRNAHKVWAADYVSHEDGTGIVHIAPAYGEEDFALAQEKDIPVVHVIDENGAFTEGPWQGKNVWEVNKQIAKDLHAPKIAASDINVVILHGIGGSPGIHWQQWLHDELLSMGCNVVMPALPDAERPDRKEWLRQVEDIMKPLDANNTIVVAHSLSVPSVLDYLESNEVNLKGFVSVGGFFEPLNAELNDYFMKEKTIDLSLVNGRVQKVAVFYGDNDPYVPQVNLQRLADNLGVSPSVIAGGGHLNTDAGYTKFSELLQTVTAFSGIDNWRGSVWKIDYIRHSYPHCHRCGTKLMYRAHPSWFMDIDGQREKMLENNKPITWFPEHVKHGRFAKTIEQAPDWNLSRDRFWATAMPVWKSPSGKVKVVGSYAELKELSGVELEDYHRPWIDDVKFTIDGEEYTRIDKVIDCWFESGSMPFAQFHYPFENKEKFETSFPGDFIVEYVGQVRAWFYYVHAVSTALFGTHAFKNVIVTGNVAGNDGRKMSKSYGNFTDPNELMDKFSADSLRFLLLSSPLLNGEDFALQDKEVGDVARKLSMVWNMYDFFTMYAEVDGWGYDGTLIDPLAPLPSPSSTASRRVSAGALAPGETRAADVSEDETNDARVGVLKNPLDIWIISRVHQLVKEVETHMDAYNIPDAMSPILPFLDDASNWYVRRSRRRFWKSEDDGDKQDAYRTLHYVLVRLAYVLAPFAPFMAEELYHNLTGDNESIHLKDWLSAGQVDEQVVARMARTRKLIEVGLGIRMKSDEKQQSVKVRQPLAFVSYSADRLPEDYEQIIVEELNVKELRHIADNVNSSEWMEVSKKLTPELKREGLMREVIRHVQSARKKAGLQVDDHIVLQLVTDNDELHQAIQEHNETIALETLAKMGEATEYSQSVNIDGAALAISLVKQ